MSVGTKHIQNPLIIVSDRKTGHESQKSFLSHSPSLSAKFSLSESPTGSPMEHATTKILNFFSTALVGEPLIIFDNIPISSIGSPTTPSPTKFVALEQSIDNQQAIPSPIEERNSNSTPVICPGPVETKLFSIDPSPTESDDSHQENAFNSPPNWAHCPNVEPIMVRHPKSSITKSIREKFEKKIDFLLDFFEKRIKEIDEEILHKHSSRTRFSAFLEDYKFGDHNNAFLDLKLVVISEISNYMSTTDFKNMNGKELLDSIIVEVHRQTHTNSKHDEKIVKSFRVKNHAKLMKAKSSSDLDGNTNDNNTNIDFFAIQTKTHHTHEKSATGDILKLSIPDDVCMEKRTKSDSSQMHSEKPHGKENEKAKESEDSKTPIIRVDVSKERKVVKACLDHLKSLLKTNDD